MASSRWTQLVRQFSSSTSRAGKLVQAPIQLYGVEGRYATALYSAATKQSKLEAVEKELSSLQTELQKNSKLLEFLADPSQKKNQKRETIEGWMKQRSFSDLTMNLFVTMAENGRMNKTQQVLSSFSKLMSAHRGEVTCSVVTAKPLDEESSKELKAALQGFLKKGQTLQLFTQVDPSLIGGMTVTIGDRFVDMSMKSRIKTYTNLIKAAV
ncbi:ATP synthase subunit O, mitochondrial-like [Physella acuta]|uniref:ATP synthase subunit O, mitochondrial-like n=1 Tax=Physella acuta TaxID=109671 RepID=UPI0027DE09CB|nr:ATP synthase subunit O, mitochondrial-like [Physella acuta]